MAEQLTRFCPGCGSVGEVDAKFRDCCPDGSQARVIPVALANKCHDLFQLALASASPPVAVQEERDAWQAIETAPKDGTDVLLRSVHSESVANGYWLQAAYAGNGAWIWPYVHKAPAYWMPLPKAPGDQP